MSEREQVWRERIEWQQWSGLTVVANRKRDDRQKRREKNRNG